MNSCCEKFLNYLFSDISELGLANEKLLSYWAPDEPPVTVIFSNVAIEFVRIIDALPNYKIQKFFDSVERGICSVDEKLSTAIATGLIETIVSETGGRGEKWNMIVGAFGRETKRHAEVWNS